jgi:hypothetical protein
LTRARSGSKKRTLLGTVSGENASALRRLVWLARGTARVDWTGARKLPA